MSCQYVGASHESLVKEVRSLIDAIEHANSPNSPAVASLLSEVLLRWSLCIDAARDPQEPYDPVVSDTLEELNDRCCLGSGPEYV